MRTLIIASIALLAFGCATVADNQQRDQAQQQPSAMDYGSPFYLLAGMIAGEDAQNATLTAEERREAYNAAYGVGYNYGIATGMTKRGAWKLARSIAANREPKLTCSDWKIAPPDCK